jgi:preprotein translocase subunit SecD
MKAGLWSLLFVALFMILLYRLPGATSIVALGVYTLGVLALYKLLPVTLTLAGIAGFILSLGIGVDANVLIFARMREELKSGKPPMTAMVEGFRRSWPSIRDSHMTTFIGAVVLYLFTTSIVKGFALTLGIGVILSLVTSTVVTRSFLTVLMGSRLARWRWLFS